MIGIRGAAKSESARVASRLIPPRPDLDNHFARRASQDTHTLSLVNINAWIEDRLGISSRLMHRCGCVRRRIRRQLDLADFDFPA